MKSRCKADTLIIGAGIIGLSLAWELSRRKQTVRVVEAGQIGRGSSWAGAGILPPTPRQGNVDPYEQLRSLSSHLHPTWAEQLREETNIDTGFRRCGGVYLANSQAEAATLLANEFWWQEHDMSFERLTAETLAKKEPNLPQLSEQSNAWWLPDECQLRNPHHLAALHKACELAGVSFHSDTPVRDIIEHSTYCELITDTKKKYCAERICIASGAWSRKFLDARDLPNGMMPVRGQMLLYECNSSLIQSVINDGNRYLVPRDDGHLLAGSVEEEVGFECSTTETGLAQIRSWAESTLPALRKKTLKRTWAGLRPGTFDGLPYLGLLPHCERIYIAAGHFRSGLHLSTGTAQVMAQLLCDETPTIDLSPFRVGRG